VNSEISMHFTIGFLIGAQEESSDRHAKNGRYGAYMYTLLIVGGGLFGSQAAALARSKGLQALVFDPGLTGGASPAAAGLFKEEWAGKKNRQHYIQALSVLDRLYGIQRVQLSDSDTRVETYQWVAPTLILERNPLRQLVTAVGDGWLEAGGQRYEGWVYIAAGVWSGAFLSGLQVTGKAGSSFIFGGERPGRVQALSRGRQAYAFVRDPGTTYFSDGTAERDFTPEHDMQSLRTAADLGLTEEPLRRLHGIRPYTPHGVFFEKIGTRTWLATGGRKMGTILGAACARRLVEEELRIV
jgi:glycine/D-amino acid oxidase-like deaminating enzyme